MRGVILPESLLSAAIGFALAFVAPKIAQRSALIFITAATVTALIPIAGISEDVAFTGCWLSVLMTAALVHIKGGISHLVAVIVMLNDGYWAGLVTHASNGASALAYALPWVLLFIPATLMVSRGWGIGIRIAASWLIAIAFLEAALVVVPTPGYKPDHMD